jgi:MtN3 and saliva related transmembrane protein
MESAEPGLRSLSGAKADNPSQSCAWKWRPGVKEIVAMIFGLGLVGNAILFVPQGVAVWRKKSDEGISLITFGGFSILQAIGIVHGVYQRDASLILGMAASLLSCGSVTVLTLFYRIRRRRSSAVKGRG